MWRQIHHPHAAHASLCFILQLVKLPSQRRNGEVLNAGNRFVFLSAAAPCSPLSFFHRAERRRGIEKGTKKTSGDSERRRRRAEDGAKDGQGATTLDPKSVGCHLHLRTVMLAIHST